jgi:hypothetical protein
MSDAGFSRAFEEALTRLRGAVDEACARQADWPQGVAAAIAAALELSASDPAAMRTLTVDAFDRGLAGALLYREAVADFASLLTKGRRECAEGNTFPPVLEEALIGAVTSLIAEAVRMGREATLPGLASELIEFVLAPYLGPGEAKRVALQVEAKPQR